MRDVVVVDFPDTGWRAVSDLADTLAKLRKRAELSRRQLEAVSGVSEETIKAIEYRRNHRPTPDTLQKIARGLATNRALARLDQRAADEVLADLMRAAGYLPAVEQDAEPAMADLRTALMARGFRPDETHVVDQILDDIINRSPDQRSQVLDAVATLLALRETSENG